MVVRLARAQHLVVGVLALIVLSTGIGAASRLAPSSRHLATARAVPTATAAALVRSMGSMGSMGMVAPRPVPVRAKTRPLPPKPVVRHTPRRPVVRREAQMAMRRSPTPAPAFDATEAQRRGSAAFRSLGRRLPSGWVIRFDVYRGRYLGFADSGSKTVTIWVRRSDSHNTLRITIAHELGHVLDFTTLTGNDKGRYLSLRGRSDAMVPWYPANGTSDYAAPAGDFAEVYALYLAGAGDFRSTFAPQPTSSQLASLGEFFSDLQARHS